MVLRHFQIKLHLLAAKLCADGVHQLQGKVLLLAVAARAAHHQNAPAFPMQPQGKSLGVRVEGFHGRIAAQQQPQNDPLLGQGGRAAHNQRIILLHGLDRLAHVLHCVIRRLAEYI